MATDKESLQEQQAKQFSQLLKDYGIMRSNPAPKGRKSADKRFSEDD